MNVKVKTTKEVEITHVKMILPVRSGSEDMPQDFPNRESDTWTAIVNIDTGKIENWPKFYEYHLHINVVDCGTYYLLDGIGNVLASIESDYVPNGVIPGTYGDYVELKINPEGIITNWPKQPDVRAFF